MRLIFSNFLLSFVLGSYFVSIQSQELDKTNTNAPITLPNNDTVEETLSAESPSTVNPGNTVTKLITVTDLVHSEPTKDYQTSTEESTAEVTIEPVSVTEQTTPKSVPERITPQEYSTLALETVTTTNVTESATSDSLPSTSLPETTGGLTSADPTSSGHHDYETTTATVVMTTSSTKALDPTTIISKQPTTDMIESTPTTFHAVDITTEAVETTSLDVTPMITTTPLLSTSQIFYDSTKLDHTTPEDDSLSAHSTPFTTGGMVRGSILPLQTNWLLIIIVCAVIICMLLAGMLLLVQRRKKNTSRRFDPGYVNGQSKKSKKKKGAETNAWAGPVHLKAEEGVECDGEVKGALMPGDGNRDEDIVLSTFSAMETDDTPNGGVGREGTAEAKNWEEQEPLLYIDEDVKEDNMGNRVGSNDTQEVNEKVGNGEKVLNGGETFCITTAV